MSLISSVQVWVICAIALIFRADLTTAQSGGLSAEAGAWISTNGHQIKETGLSTPNTAALETNTTILPVDQTNGFSNARGGLTSGESYQLCYHSRNFLATSSKAIFVTGIAYRLDEADNRIDLAVPNLEIWASTFTNDVSRLSSHAAFNFGPDHTLVFSRQGFRVTAERNLSSPSDFQIDLPLTTAFFYDPKAGHLLLDINSRGPYTGVFGWVDGVGGEGDLVSKVRSLAAGDFVTPGVGDVIQLSFIRIPELNCVTDSSGRIKLTFVALDGISYAVDFKTNLAPEGAWLSLTNYPPGNQRSIDLFAPIENFEKYFRLSFTTIVPP